MWIIELLACTGAGPAEPVSDAEAEPFACELGVLREGSFVPLAEAETVELHLGFQGFLLLALHARAEDPPTEVDATVGVTVDGLDPYSVSQPRVAFTDGVTDELLVFLTSNYASWYEGRTASLGLRLRSADRVCVTEGAAVLVDEDPCIHTGGEPVCPDTGE
ncbi:MAG: hypothetical protein Q8P18_06610 [Pseudomonadota bacterium]|nr:hypothetical protein [Pseudomonadota bacterium]